MIASLNSGTTFLVGILFWIGCGVALALGVGRMIREAEDDHHDLDSIERFENGRRVLRGREAP